MQASSIFLHGRACAFTWLVLLSGAAHVHAQKAAGKPLNATVGVPETLQAGVSQTTADIMANPEITRTRKNGYIKEEREVEWHENRPQAPAAPATATFPASTAGGPAKAKLPITSSPQATSTSFTGAVLADTGAFPPDSMGAVGPTQYVVFVNGRLRTFNKATGVADGVLNANPDVFFAPVETPVPQAGVNFTSDPNVRYDRLSKRWFLTIIDVPSSTTSTIGDTPNRVLIAVSDAAGNGVLSASTVWTFFYVQQNTLGGANTNEFLDYPSLGIDANALYIGGNMFGATSGSFTGNTALVIRKSSVLGSGPIVATAFRGLTGTGTAEGPFAPRGVDNYDPASTEGYFIGNSNIAYGRLDLRRVSDPGGTPAISANILLTVPTTAAPIPVAHLGNTGGNNGRLDSLDDRLYAAHIRNGRLWTAHNIGVLASGVGGGTTGATGTKRDAVRWYEIVVPPTTGTPTLNQSGTVFDTAANVSTARQYWIPSVTPSGQGHAALAFSTAGTTFRADAATNGRLAGDPLGTLGAPTFYTATATAYNPSSDPGTSAGRRWGDYSFVSLDPNDDMTMWGIGEFCDSANSYGDRIVKLLAPPPAAPSSAASSVASGQSSVSVAITGTVAAGSGFFDPGASFPNRLSASVSGGVTVNAVTYTDPTHVTLDLNTTGAPGGAKDVTITNPDGQALTGSGILTVTASATALNFLSAASRLINGTAGTFDIPLPLTGASGVEDRNGNGTYTVVMTFDQPVNAGSATTTAGSVSGVTFSGNSMLVALSSVPDQQALTVTAANVSGVGTAVIASASVSAAFLVGDVNGDRFVDAGDTQVARLRAGQTVDATTFRTDVNLDGFIDAGDTTVVRTRSGHSVP